MLSQHIHKGTTNNCTGCVHTGPHELAQEQTQEQDGHRPVCLHSAFRSVPTSCLGKVLQEAHQQPVVCLSCPQTHTSVTLKPSQNARHTHAHPWNSIYSKIRTSSTSGTESADSLRCDMATHFTGWCSHKARTFSSPGKIPPGHRRMTGASEKHRHNPGPASAQKQK